MARKFVYRHLSFVVHSLPLWTLLLVVLLASASLWGPGIVNTRGGGDSPFLLQRTHQMVVNLRAGVFPVRWMPDAAYGLGYPFFNHYSALPFYLAASFNLLGLDLLTALKLTQTLGFLIAALAMFGWVNHLWRNRVAAWLAAVAYTVAPFHLVNVYVRGDSLSEFYAFAFYPMILWALDRTVERAESRNVVVVALAYAGLILSHNISAFIFSPFLLLYLFLVILRAKNTRHQTRLLQRGSLLGLKPLWMALIGLLLGVALSAWAWLPALLERDYVQSDTLTLGYFNFANHFRDANLIQLRPLFDYSIAVTTDGASPYAMSGAQAVVGMVGLLVLLRIIFYRGRWIKSQQQKMNVESPFVLHPSSFVYLIMGLLLSTVMITPLSRPLWEHLPLLEMVQFPWRFLSVQALFTAAAAAALVLRLRGWQSWGMAGGIAALFIFSTLLPLRPERLPIGPEDVTTTRLQEYELFTGNIGTTVRSEWLPREARPRPFTSDAVINPIASPQVIPLAGTLEDAQQIQRGPIDRVWRIRIGNVPATLAFPVLYWPGWHAKVDGEATPVRAVEGAGYLALDIPAGEHTVQLELGRTPLRAWAETLSLTALLVGLVLAVWRIKLTQSKPVCPAQGARRDTAESQTLREIQCGTFHALRFTPHALLVLIGVLFLAARSSPPRNQPDDLTMDFVAMPYLHHNPAGVEFDDQARLSNYALSGDQLAPGDILTIEMYWEGEQSADSTQVVLRLVSPAEHLPDLKSGPYSLAEDAVPLTGTTIHRLIVPENTPKGLYLLQLHLRGPDGELSARTDSGEERGPIFLRPVRVVHGAPLPSGTPLLARVGPDIRLHTAALELDTESNRLTVNLEWSTARRMASNYGISVRLVDPNGVRRVATDSQPGYGFTPTSLWRPDERVADRYNLSLPDDLPPGDRYRLTIVFYQGSSLAEVARVALGPFTLPLESPVSFETPPRRFALPLLSQPLDIDFVDSVGGDHIRLAGYDLIPQSNSFDLTLWWTAPNQPQKDYTVFVHLFEPATEDILVQQDAMPLQGSHPTSGWLAGEVVSETLRLDLVDVPPGAYRVAVGLYQASTGVRLSAITPGGDSLPDQRLVLPDELEATGK